MSGYFVRSNVNGHYTLVTGHLPVDRLLLFALEAGVLSSCLRAAKGSSKVPFCDYDEETSSYVSLSRTAEHNWHFATQSKYTHPDALP